MSKLFAPKPKVPEKFKRVRYDQDGIWIDPEAEFKE